MPKGIQYTDSIDDIFVKDSYYKLIIYIGEKHLTDELLLKLKAKVNFYLKCISEPELIANIVPGLNNADSTYAILLSFDHEPEASLQQSIKQQAEKLKTINVAFDWFMTGRIPEQYL